jgi:hypothetical protein
MNPFLLMAALADLAAAVVHGLVGHRLILVPLKYARLFSTRAFGAADVSRRVLVVTWHLTTATFAASALMMSLWASGIVPGGSGPLFVSAMHATFLLIGLGVMGPRISGLFRRRIPVTFVALMTTVAVMGWLGSG